MLALYPQRPKGRSSLLDRPKRLGLLLLLGQAGLVFGCAAVSASAQEQEDVVTARPWRLVVTGGVGLSDNIRFTPSTESSSAGRLSARLTRSLRTPRVTLNLGAGGDGRYYRDVIGANGINYSGEVSATYLFSPRTTLRVSDSVSRTFTDESVLLIEAGLFLPRAVTRSNSAAIEASHRMSPRWGWTVSTQHQILRFDSNRAVGGSSFAARATLNWTPARDFPLGLSYQFSRASQQGRLASDWHGATLGAQRRLGQRVSARLELGAQRLVSPVDEAKSLRITTTAGLTVRSRKQSIDATLVRALDSAFGLGRLRQRSTASLRFGRTLVPRLVVSLNASLSRSVDPGGNQSLTFDTKNLEGGLGYELSQRVQLQGAYGYRSLEPSAARTTRSRVASLTVRVGHDW